MFIGRGQIPQNYQERPGLADIAALGFGIAAVFRIGAMGTASVIAAIGTVGYIIFVALLYWRAIKAAGAIGFRKTVAALLWISGLGFVVSGLVVFKWHWLPFSLAEWTVIITYVAAVGLGLLRPEFPDIDRIYASRIIPVSKNEKQNISVRCAINRSKVRATSPRQLFIAPIPSRKRSTMCSQPELNVAVELTPCSVQGLYSTNLSEFLLRKITLRESPLVPLIGEMGLHVFS